MTATVSDARSTQPRPGRARRRRSTTRRSRDQRDAWLLVLPALVPVLVLSVFPLVRGIYLGFTDARAGLGITTHFTGFANYRELWHDSLFLDSFRIGLIWAVTVTVTQFALGLGLALAAQREPATAMVGPHTGAGPVGDAAGHRRDHVAPAAQPDGRAGQSDAAVDAPQRHRDQLARRLQHRAAGRHRHRRLGRHAADHDHAPRRDAEHRR